jgi:glutathione S-transferase
MKLYFNKPSPYARKVRVVIHEKRLVERIEWHEVDPWVHPPALLAASPIGKVPALVADDGTLFTESATIAEYLDSVGSGPSLMTGDRFAILARAALAQGLTDAAFGIVIERRRPAERQWESWAERLRRVVDRTLPMIAVAEDRFDLGDISVACALAYMDFRLSEIPWRAAYPRLAAWLDGVNQRPSMVATAV